MKLIKSFLPVVVFLASVVAFADVVTVPTDEFITAFWQFVGQLHGASVLVVVAGVVQLLMKFFSTSLANFAGKYRLLVILSLTLVGSVIGLMSQGMTLSAALLNGATLTAFQVLINQIYKQFIQKGSETVLPPTL